METTMANTKWENLILVVDVKSRSVVNRFAYQEWPQMIPATHTTTVRQWKGWNDFTDKEWDSFDIVWPSVATSLERRDNPLSNEDIARLQIERRKAGVAWRWLGVLYMLDKSVTGMIPGIDIAATPAEEDLLRQERETVRGMIKQDLQDYWPRIWACTSLDEIEAIATEIKLSSRNSQAFN